jgi:cyclophilin family peptidyl-prolyl cis-trans isomerase
MLPIFSILIISLCVFAATLAEKTQFVQCDSTAGSWTVEVHPSWSPNGAKRYLDLVEDGFFDGSPLFRAVPGFLVQFGISMKPGMNEKWNSNIQDDPFPMQVWSCEDKVKEMMLLGLCEAASNCPTPRQ